MQALSTRLEPVPTAGREARRFVRDVLSVWGIDGQLADLAVLLTDELVSNALLHAVPPIDVDLQWDPPRLRVAVSDGADQMPEMVEPPRPTGRGGFGLHIVERLAHTWGAGRRPKGGKVVWFEIDHPPHQRSPTPRQATQPHAQPTETHPDSS